MHKIISVLILAVVAVSTVLTPTAQALGFAAPPSLSNKQKAHQNIIFTGSGDDSKVCSETSTILTGSSNEERVWNFFIKKGLSPKQTAGVMGNISVESGFDPENIQNPAGTTKDPSGLSAGWGLIQWTPGSKIIGLLKTANINTPVYELSTQLNLVWWHMNNSSPTGYKNMYESYKNITSVEEATQFYESSMEGARIPHMDVRIQRANEALRKFSVNITIGVNGSLDVTEPDSDANDCGDGNGGVASSAGFTFPLKTNQSIIKAGSGGIWCYEKLTNCHHDYKAADIMAPTGTVVIAAKDGVVVSTHSGNQHPNNVTIRSSDGAGINYYTHMGANTVVVKNGQSVKAGDVLGKVGTSVDAMGTAPHLHFDMLPSKYKYRPSCTGAGCNSYPFIEVQPPLVETFNMLPKN